MALKIVLSRAEIPVVSKSHLSLSGVFRILREAQTMQFRRISAIRITVFHWDVFLFTSNCIVKRETECVKERERKSI